MRRWFRRSMLWLLPIVLVPIGALAVSQYRLLRALEQKTASAERNWMRNSLELATSDIEWSYRRAAASALSMSEEQLASVMTLGRHFAENSVPGARTFFAIRFNGDRAEHGFFDAQGHEKHPTETEAEAVKMATVAWHMAHVRDRVLAQPPLLGDQRADGERVILRPIVDASLHVIGVTGVILDEKASRQAMALMARRAIKARHRNKLISVTIAERFPHGGRDYITQPLGFVFSDLRAGIRDQCSTPEEMAALTFRNNMKWTGGGFVALLGAVALALGAVMRQMRLSQMKSEFVSNVSHELRTPLSSIRVFGEYMRLGRVTDPAKVQQYGEYIEAESRRLTALINNILDFSKIESSEKNYRFCEADVVDLIGQTVAAFEVPLREQGVSIVLNTPAQRPAAVLVDKDAFAQVLVNLLDNAVKFSNGRKEIEVTVSTSADAMRIAVRDHGIGIHASEQKKIFEKFYRVGSGLVHDVKGSGLGLSIVQHVVKAHGGTVEVSSTPGAGTTFTIVLPFGGATGAARGISAAGTPAATAGEHA
jgi:signal transduction histidine kinase